MGADEGTPATSEWKRWTTTYNNLAFMLRTQQAELECLLNDRKLLESRIKTQHNRWASVVSLLQDQIFHMKCDVELEIGKRLVECAKSDLVVGMKRREADLLKLKLDHVTNDLAENQTMWLDLLSQEAQNIKPLIEEKARKESINKSSSKKDDQRIDLLMSEAINLEEIHAKLSEQKDAEISTLLSEKKSLSSKLKTIESKFSHKLKVEQVKVKDADKKVEKLKIKLEQLRSSNNEKDRTIEALKAKINVTESKMKKRDEEISIMPQEMKMLKRTGGASMTPILNKCSMKPKISGSRKSSSDKSSILAKKGRDDSKVAKHESKSEEETRSLKRKGVEAVKIPDAPKLFSASFKVPKLKSSS